MLKFKYTITVCIGIHTRPAGLPAEAADAKLMAMGMGIKMDETCDRHCGGRR